MLKEVKIYLIRDSGCHGQESNFAYPEYKLGASPLESAWNLEFELDKDIIRDIQLKLNSATQVCSCFLLQYNCPQKCLLIVREI
jgi:hypothetical protein